MLKEQYQQLYLNYIANSSLSDSLKNTLSDSSFIDDNPEFYLYYPHLFSVYFDVEQEKEDLLCVAGYLYYQATIFLDKVVDNKNLDLLFPAMVCQEEAIKILGNLFPAYSDFWKIWNQRKEEYQKAIWIEKRIRQNPTYEAYTSLAILKATFGNCAIDGMYYLDLNHQKKSIFIMCC